MRKKPKPKRKPSKLFRPNVVDLKQQFDTAHQKGMKALKGGDYKAFGDAVCEERKVIDQLPKGMDVIKPTRKR